MVMAMTKSQVLRSEEAGPSWPISKWWCGRKRSQRLRAIAPRAMPAQTTSTPGTAPNISLPYSMPGATREKEVAASITPAARPSIASSHLWGMFLKKMPGSAPRVVPRPASVAAITPYRNTQLTARLPRSTSQLSG